MREDLDGMGTTEPQVLTRWMNLKYIDVWIAKASILFLYRQLELALSHWQELI